MNSILPINVRTAIGSERSALEALQWRASLNNPGDREALLANPDAIELPLQQLQAGGVFVAEADGSIKGFEAWRWGIGRALVEHCCDAARSAGAAALHVVGNPHAEGFYLSCGFHMIGTKQMRFGVGLLMKRELTPVETRVMLSENG